MCGGDGGVWCIECVCWVCRGCDFVHGKYTYTTIRACYYKLYVHVYTFPSPPTHPHTHTPTHPHTHTPTHQSVVPVVVGDVHLQEHIVRLCSLMHVVYRNPLCVWWEWMCMGCVCGKACVCVCSRMVVWCVLTAETTPTQHIYIPQQQNKHP